MAAFVRSVGTPTTATSASPTLTVGASGVALGDTVVVGIASNASTAATSVTDSKGNTYTAVGTPASNANLTVEQWASVLTVALVSADLVTVNFPSSRATSIGALEFSGIPSVAVDVSNQGQALATDVPPTASLTTATANDVVTLITADSASLTIDTPTPANYVLGCNKPSSVPSFYMNYSLVVAAGTVRTEGVAQWTNTTGAVGTSNVALLTQAKSGGTLRFTSAGHAPAGRRQI